MTKMPTSRTIPALLDEQAEKFGEREAVVSGSERLSYRALRLAVRRAARGLLALGVQPGDPVAILMGNRTEWIVAFLAVQQLGATAVGLNTWATPREMAYSLAHAEVKYLIAVERLRRNDYRAMFEAMQPLASSLPALRSIVWLAAEPDARPAPPGELTWERVLAMGEQIPEARVDAAAQAVDGDAVALLLYTSGSTAAPKGILLQHRLWIANAWNIGERQKVTEQDRLWLAVSLFWSFGSVNALPNMLSHGACVVLQESFDAGEALALIERERCSIMYGTPNMVQALLEHPSRPGRDLSSLRSGAMIGTPEQLMGAVNLGAREICNVYGLSETYGNCAVIDAKEPLAVRLQSVGQPLPGVTLRICHMETGQPLPAGEVGEIRVKGPLFLAYYKDEEKTREAYDADGFFHTGDLGMLDEAGRLYYRGRLKEMVKSGGINVAPIEVEEALMRHPAVRTAYVIGMPDPHLDEVLVAIVIAREGASCTEEELLKFCKKELAAYKVPARFRMATDDELPLTTTGKVQKMKLRELLQDAPAT
ncbi:AMP-binding protein [Ramlibacter sp. 2FC]|uniref:AMP-binding protein n=1 Tax=Ramlibacter sp. 2FC TaxID=2502188 RepID=UPI0010F6E634|nr:AMP-binding protein [Ramlibacter sp. 2FC]